MNVTDHFLDDLDREIARAEQHHSLGPAQIDGWLERIAAREEELGCTDTDRAEYARRRDKLDRLRRGPPTPPGLSSI
jgi:hypothetical protein